MFTKTGRSNLTMPYYTITISELLRRKDGNKEAAAAYGVSADYVAVIHELHKKLDVRKFHNTAVL